MEKKFFDWTPERIQFLRDNYSTLGPTKLAKHFGTSLASVQAKAKRLGVEKKEVAPATEWTEEMLTTLKRIYETADRETLVQELRLPLYVIRQKARKLGLRNLTGKKRGAENKSKGNISCDIHYFDQWSEKMAHILGFLFADGSVTSRLCDVVVGLAKSDAHIIDYIKGELKSVRPLYIRPAFIDPRGRNHQESIFLTLASKIMVRRLLELGLKPRKTYNDDPFPDVPVDMLPHFIRGYFDGDGAVVNLHDDRYSVRFTGSPKFITGIRDSLVKHTNMTEVNVVLERSKTCEWAKIAWGKKEDICKFYEYVYPTKLMTSGLEKTYTFCLERKRQLLRDYIYKPVISTPYHKWTDGEEQLLRDRYQLVGPGVLSKQLGVTYTAVRSKAQELGIIKGKEDKEETSV